MITLANNAQSMANTRRTQAEGPAKWKRERHDGFLPAVLTSAMAELGMLAAKGGAVLGLEGDLGCGQFGGCVLEGPRCCCEADLGVVLEGTSSWTWGKRLSLAREVQCLSDREEGRTVTRKILPPAVRKVFRSLALDSIRSVVGNEV